MKYYGNKLNGTRNASPLILRVVKKLDNFRIYISPKWNGKSPSSMYCTVIGPDRTNRISTTTTQSSFNSEYSSGTSIAF